VRLLHAAMQASGLKVYSRITGVLPRELGPAGIRTISRSATPHVEEMHWWLHQLPSTTRAIVMENSAISPDLQNLAGRWLRPDLTILTNTLPDHQEAWGPGKASATEVLTAGIPRRGQVVIPTALASEEYLQTLLAARCCKVILAEPVTQANGHYNAVNLGLALNVTQQLGLDSDPALKAMLALEPDSYDFQIIDCAGAELAMAFSVNDVTSTKALFQSLQWRQQETRLIYNHRADRPDRLKSFVNWLGNTNWREVLVIGDRPRMRIGSAKYIKIRDLPGLLCLFHPGDRVFGCGNIAGLPLSLATTQHHLTEI